MRRRTLVILAAAIIAVIVIVAAAVFVLSPRPASTATHKAAGIATVVGTPVPTTGLTKYSLVGGDSSASYSVHEDLIFGGVGSHTAVGTSHNVSGSFYLGLAGNRPSLTRVDVTVDLTTLQSDSSLRDGHVQDYLETSQFPSAQFVSTNIKGLPATYTPGQTISFQIVGNLTIRGVTNQETFAASGKVTGNTVTATATTTIFMSDFGITPPDLANIAIVDNKVTLSINFTAQG